MHGSRTRADLDWLRAGDHVCHFYDTAEDLADVLIPHFKAGLERREACIWIAGNPFGPERARSEMRTAVADFDNRVAAGQMQIVSQDEWSEKCGALGTAERIRNWLSWKDEAVASGYTGVRTGGDLSSLYESSFEDFLDYERAADNAFRRQPIVALCSYCLARYSGQAVLNAMQGHGFGLARRHGLWKPIEAWQRNQSTTRVPHAPSAPRPGHEADLGQIIEELLAVYMVAYPGCIALEGGPVTLPALSASKLRLALHELASNAVQFGALAIPQGALAVSWYAAVNGSRRLHMTWAESGLSGLTIPNRVGRGTRALAGAVENCVRTFESTGVRYTFELGL